MCVWHVINSWFPFWAVLGVHAIQVLACVSANPNVRLCAPFVASANLPLSHQISHQIVLVWSIPSSEFDLGIFVADLFIFVIFELPLRVCLPSLLTLKTILNFCSCFANLLLIVVGASCSFAFNLCSCVFFFSHHCLALAGSLVMCLPCSQPFLPPSSSIDILCIFMVKHDLGFVLSVQIVLFGIDSHHKHQKKNHWLFGKRPTSNKYIFVRETMFAEFEPFLGAFSDDFLGKRYCWNPNPHPPKKLIILGWDSFQFSEGNFAVDQLGVRRGGFRKGCRCNSCLLSQ